MNFVALKMLTGDRAKYLGLIFAIAFCTFLLENQTSIFASILKRTGSQILGCFTRNMSVAVVGQQILRSKWVGKPAVDRSLSLNLSR